MDPRPHRQIGEIALERDFIGFETLTAALLAIEGMPSAPDIRVWIRRGWLDRPQLAAVVAQIDSYAVDPSGEQTAPTGGEALDDFVHADTALVGSEETTGRSGPDGVLTRETAAGQSDRIELDVDEQIDSIPATIPLDLGEMTIPEQVDPSTGRFIQSSASESPPWFGQSREAIDWLRRGDEAVERYRDVRDEVEAYDGQIQSMAAKIVPHAPIDRKRPLWRLEDRKDALRADAERAAGQAVVAYARAMAVGADNNRAAERLAEFYLLRCHQAESAGDETAAVFYESQVRQYGSRAVIERLESTASLAVDAVPIDASATLFEFEELDRRLVAGQDVDIGRTPLKVDGLDAGSYLLVVDHDDRAPIRAPVELGRGDDERIELRLPRPRDLQDGFVYIAGGTFASGGDPRAVGAVGAAEVHVDPFFCQRLPVTFDEYLEWFNLLYRSDPDAAMARAPQLRRGDELLIRFEERFQRWVAKDDLVDRPTRQRHVSTDRAAANLPVTGVRAEDAEAYCQWRARQDGRRYRLASREELEKAGRGVDGRCFPWGHAFDPTFCKVYLSRPERAQLEPVGAFVDDSSPYGVRDLAGGVCDWCQSDGQRPAERPIFGGAWSHGEQAARLASRRTAPSQTRSTAIGFRMVYRA